MTRITILIKHVKQYAKAAKKQGKKDNADGVKNPRTEAQIAATAKMIEANKLKN